MGVGAVGAGLGGGGLARTCPCPRAMVLKVMLSVSASCSSWLVGSTPGERTKMRGGGRGVAKDQVEVEHRRLGVLLAQVDHDERVGREDDAVRPQVAQDDEPLQLGASVLPLPGSRAAEVSGSGWRYHSFQSRAEDSKEVRMLRKEGSLSSSVMWSHTVSSIQSEQGLGGGDDLSVTCPLRRKKSYSCRFNFLAPCKILVQIWKEKRSLCTSKSARHVER